MTGKKKETKAVKAKAGEARAGEVKAGAVKAEKAKPEGKKAKKENPVEAKAAEENAKAVKKSGLKPAQGGAFSYEALLSRAEELLPHKTEKVEERFKLPAPSINIQGNRTYLANLAEIANRCGREPQHLLKFLARELATFGSMEGGQAVFVGKFSYALVKEKELMYFREFVRCEECGKPDTKIIKEERQPVMKCMACGAKHPVRVL